VIEHRLAAEGPPWSRCAFDFWLRPPLQATLLLFLLETPEHSTARSVMPEIEIELLAFSGVISQLDCS
jgi:hypothetical protein